MIIGDRIKKKRLSMNLSQEQLAKLVGLSKVTISGYEKGSKKPRLDQLEKLSDVLKLSPNYLLGYDIDVIEDSTNYVVTLSKDDLKVLNEIKNYPELYNKMISDPKRMIELISRRVK